MKTRYSKTRIGVLFILFTMAFALFVSRLVFVQIVKGAELRNKGRRQYIDREVLPASRGEIYDTMGRKVVANSSFFSLAAYPVTAEDIANSYRVLARTFGSSVSSCKRAYPLHRNRFRWIKRGLAHLELARFKKYNSGNALFLREEPTRSYPFGDVGRSILGFVNIDDEGRSGIELTMESHLAGRDGLRVVNKDGLGRSYRLQEIPVQDADPGESVVLTIDWVKQQIVEEELAAAVARYNAKGGMAVFLDPFTGAIIAAAEFFPASTDRPQKAAVAANIFEPGSVFKLIAAATALEEKAVAPCDTFFAENGAWRLGRRTLRDDHEFGWLTFREAFENSSNIAIGKIACEAQGEKVLAMARRFGFGRLTGCELNGEAAGVVEPPYRWSEYTTSAFAIGHGLSVTAVQVAEAFGVIAADGYLNRPYLVKGFLSDRGEFHRVSERDPIRVLDDDVVDTLRSFLSGVVERGTATPIKNSPIPIAGKTGTAEKPDLEHGGYQKHRFTASFAGYFPADRPRLAGVVVLDEPRPITYGGYTSAPTFMHIAGKFAALDKYETNYAAYQAPDTAGNTEEETTAVAVAVPDLVGESPDKALYLLHQGGLDGTCVGRGETVLFTKPAPYAGLSPEENVKMFLGRKDQRLTEAPDLAGLTIREAISVLSEHNVPFALSGNGRIVAQTPGPGEPLGKGGVMTLVCRRGGR